MHFKLEIRHSLTEASECETERKMPKKKTQDQDGYDELGKMSRRRKGEHGRMWKARDRWRCLAARVGS
jgi:hypothetical protein